MTLSSIFVIDTRLLATNYFSKVTHINCTLRKCCFEINSAAWEISDTIDVKELQKWLNYSNDIKVCDNLINS